MDVRSFRSADGMITTELEGRLADQTALAGALDAIHDLRMILTSELVAGEHSSFSSGSLDLQVGSDVYWR